MLNQKQWLLGVVIALFSSCTNSPEKSAEKDLVTNGRGECEQRDGGCLTDGSSLAKVKPAQSVLSDCPKTDPNQLSVYLATKAKKAGFDQLETLKTGAQVYRQDRPVFNLKDIAEIQHEVHEMGPEWSVSLNDQGKSALKEATQNLNDYLVVFYKNKIVSSVEIPAPIESGQITIALGLETPSHFGSEICGVKKE